jgi:hypothetical protein
MGKYGDSNHKNGFKQMPVQFQTQLVVIKNPQYSEDFDEDGILNEMDNCRYLSNPEQKDINYNDIGDACEDSDRDGIMNSLDNCVDTRNYDQIDSDGDGIGNACDEEDDRFLEKNNDFVYLIVGFIIIVFVFLTFIIMKNKK